MLSRGHHTSIFIISMFMLLLLTDLLAKFIITCTLKNKVTTWLLASLHNLFSFKIEHTLCYMGSASQLLWALSDY
jgi:hypothetical protein